MEIAKVHWRDSGLVHALLGARSRKNLPGQSWVGASWEGWVIEQTLSHLDALGVEHEAFFLRTSDGYDVDLFIERGNLGPGCSSPCPPETWRHAG